MPKQSDNTKRAAALKYDPLRDDAPIISALGLGAVADKIIETAQAHDIPIVENDPLADVLSRLSIGDAIPPRLYEAVAQILIFISQKDGDYSKLRF